MREGLNPTAAKAYTDWLHVRQLSPPQTPNPQAMRVFFFDIDGTLIRTDGAGRAAIEAAMESEFGLPPDSSGIAVNGRTDRSIASDLFKAHRLEDSEANWQRLQAGYVRHLPVQLGQRSGAVLPGVKELLSHLGQCENVALGLLTGNVPGGARLKLTHFGLHEHFDFGGFGHAHMSRDEVARTALSEARQWLGGKAAPEQCWVIGDTEHDVQCARHIGAKVLAVATGGSKKTTLQAAGPDHLLDDLSATDEVLRVLTA